MSNNRFAGFDKLTAQEQENMMKDYLEEQVKIFIVGTSSLNEQNASFKAIAVSNILFYKVKEMSKEKGISFSSLIKNMIKNSLRAYDGDIHDYTAFFLKSLGYVSETEKLATACDFAWKNLEPRLPRLVRSYNYFSEDKHLLYALNRIGVERIAGAQEVVDMYNNKINKWELKSIKEDFYKYYAEALKKNLTLELVTGTGTLKSEIKSSKPNQALLGSPESPLKMIDENVKRISENIMIEIGR
jgi:hypothetical protein